MSCPSVHVMLRLLPRWRRHSRRCIPQWPRGSAALSRPRRAPGGGGERGEEASASQWCGCAAQPGSPRCGQRRWGGGGWGFWEFRLRILRWEWNMTHKSQEIQILDDWLTPLKRMIFYGRARPELKARLVQNRAPWLQTVNQVWNRTMLHPIVSSGGLSFHKNNQNNKFKQLKAWLPQKIIGSHVWLSYTLYSH